MRLTLTLLAALMLAPVAAMANDIRTVVLAGGCFWCVESDFDKVEGVTETVSGYAGGTTDDPSYLSVTGGDTGHLEVVRVTYDADVISHEDILHLFLRAIDPTDDGGQFCDRGDSYRTAIFYADEAEQVASEQALVTASDQLGKPLATRLLSLDGFWPAEDFHQDYHQKNPLRYQIYRKGCGRDRIIQQVWGDAAAFANKGS